MAEHELSAADLVSWADGVAEVQQRIGPRFARSEQRQRVRRYLDGKVDSYKDAQIRRALNHIHEAAQQTSAVFSGVHWHTALHQGQPRDQPAAPWWRQYRHYRVRTVGASHHRGR